MNKYLSASSFLFFVHPWQFFITLFDQNKVGKKESAEMFVLDDILYDSETNLQFNWFFSHLDVMEEPKQTFTTENTWWSTLEPVSTEDIKTWSCCDSSDLNSVWCQTDEQLLFMVHREKHKSVWIWTIKRQSSNWFRNSFRLSRSKMSKRKHQQPRHFDTKRLLKTDTVRNSRDLKV